MATEGLKPVGVEVVAANAEQATAAVNNFAQAERGAASASEQLARSYAEAGIRESEVVQALEKLGYSHKESVASATAAFDALEREGVAITDLSAKTTVSTEATQQNTQAVQQNTVALDENGSTHQRTGQSAQNLFTTMREGRLVMGMMIADMALMQLTAGQTNPALQEMSKGIQVVIDSALLGTIVFGPWGTAIGLVVGAGIALGQMATATSEGMKALNKELDNSAKKDDAAAELAKIAGVTEEVAAKALDATKNMPELADRLKDAKEKTEGWTIAWEALTKELAISPLAQVATNLTAIWNSFAQGLTPVQAMEAELFVVGLELNDLSHGNFSKMWTDWMTGVSQFKQQLSDAKNELTDTTNSASALDGVIKQLATDQKDLASQQDKMASTDFLGGMVKAWSDAGDTIAKDEQKYTDTIAKDWRSLQDELSNLAVQRRVDEQNTARAIEDANQKMADSIAKAQQTLADQEANIAVQLSTKQSESYRTYQKSIESTNNDIQKAAQELADRIVAINKKEVEDLAALDWKTGESLNAAKTQNDKEVILERRANEAAAIRQRAEDERSSAQDAFEKAKAASEQKKQLALDEYNYRTALNAREAAQQDADAKRKYAEEVAQAQKSNQEQIAQLNERLKEQEAALDRQAENSRRRYDEQVADAKKALNEEVAAVIDSANKKVQALQAELQARANAIQMLEQQIALEEYEKNLFAINQALSMTSLAFNAASLVNGQSGGSSRPQYGGEYANGGDFIASSPTLIQVGENYKPERVTITPMGANNSRNIGNVTVNITGNDPEQIWNTFQRKMQNEVWH